VGTGSRALGVVVLLIGGLWCARVWTQRHDTRTAAMLLGIGLFAFVVSHVLALAIGAWPSVLLVAATMAFATWTWADSALVNSGRMDERSDAMSYSLRNRGGR
jgi:hypothetical protein